ncbi:hypothetical protein CPter91_0391 [Collimonas pratensis]|uniref:Uncharacterized protein n=1 Tax=Collimonas pratensis TaxID=279113 RepID=A0A127PY87_9BURK|nr:hypothetical protein CPter91_0391 [Collimonas pratensis]
MMMPLWRRAAFVFDGANSQFYGDLPPVLGTKLGSFGIA